MRSSLGDGVWSRKKPSSAFGTNLKTRMNSSMVNPGVPKVSLLNKRRSVLQIKSLPRRKMSLQYVLIRGAEGVVIVLHGSKLVIKCS